MYTGYSLASLVNRSAMDKQIDDATGYERVVIGAFLDWVAINVFGVEEKDQQEQEWVETEQK